MNGHLEQVYVTSTAHWLWRKVGRIFPEVVDVGVGIGHEMGMLREVEVVLQDGDDAFGYVGISSKGRVVETVLAIAVGVIEALTLRRTAEAFGFGQRVKVDDGNFAWGETVSEINFSWSTYKYCNGTRNSLTKYNKESSYGIVDNKTVLEPNDDAAHVNWGGTWRMPTEAEWRELSYNYTSTWTSNFKGSGVTGRIITSNKDGYTDKSIFLPAAGGGGRPPK